MGFCLFDFFHNQVEHAGELREQQDAPPFFDQLRQHVHEQVELGALLHLVRAGQA